jgi:subtilisin family serine protease
LLAGLCLAAVGGSAQDTRAQSPDETVIISIDTPTAVRAKHPRDHARRAAIESRKQQLLDAFAGELDVVYRYDGSAAVAVRAPLDVIERLRRSGAVRGITPNRQVFPALNQSATLINAVEPRDTWGITGDGVVVAVLDTGIDGNHPDLADDVLFERCYSEVGNCLGNTTSLSGPGAAADIHGHGTHVSGIITSNGVVAPKGIAPDVKIAAYKVLANGSGTYADIMAGLNDILMNHPEVDIVNMSISDLGNWTTACDAVDPMGAAAIDQLRAAGVLAFAASGNDGYTGGINWPACLSNVVSTGAVWDETLPSVSFLSCTQTPAPADAVTCFSDSSNELDLLAPGAFITSTALGGGTMVLGGTSQASPTAAAVAALVLEADPSLSPAALESVLESSGVPILDERNSIVRPRVDAEAAIFFVSPDSDNDGLPAAADNCPGVANPAQQNTDKDRRPNGPLLSGDDATWPMSDTAGDDCDADDDNDGLNDADEATGAACDGTPTDPLLVDHDGDRLTDGWECAHVNDLQPPDADAPIDPAVKFFGVGAADGDADHVVDTWEHRGYNASGSAMDSDADGCADLVETASVDGNKAVTDADRLAVARRALNIWGPNPEHDIVFDIDKNGVVGDSDRLFVARAALLAAWQPKTCP